MFKSKKGDMNILLIMFIQMIFSVILILGIVFAFIFFIVGYDYVTLPLYQVGVDMNSSAEIQAGYENTVESYADIDISGISDNIWFYSYFSMSTIGLFAAYRSRNSNFFTFLSMITYGMMFMIFIFSFFLVIMKWLYFDILLNLFTNLTPNLIMMEWWINNAGIMFLLQGSLMLLVKVIDFDFSSWRNRRKADGAVFDDEVM